jgi:hypothetical protein
MVIKGKGGLATFNIKRSCLFYALRIVWFAALLPLVTSLWQVIARQGWCCLSHREPKGALALLCSNHRSASSELQSYPRER